MAGKKLNVKEFGGRVLSHINFVFDQNAWDNVEWDDEQIKNAEDAVVKNSKEKLSEAEFHKFTNKADQFWNTFYATHQDRFFKDRHWLLTEFPVLGPSSIGHQQDRSVFEIGCGVGNSILPILLFNKSENLKIYGCDFSENAIEALKKNSIKDQDRCTAFVMDATMSEWAVPFEKNTIDIILLIFTLSAIPPGKVDDVIRNCYEYLKPGGSILFRDYGRLDLAQLRIKPGRCLQDNHYVRGDGTMVYFFTPEELQTIFTKHGFIEEENFVDRRLQTNRFKKLKMYRIWLQMKYKKPLQSTNLPIL